MKNKGLVIGVGFIAILLLGAGYFFMNQKTAKQPSKTKGNAQNKAEQEAKSLRDLLSAGVAQKCTYTIADENGQNEGVTYVANNKVRADFSVTENGKQSQTHMISDGQTSWIWTDGEAVGFKMTAEKTKSESEPENASEAFFQAGVNLDEKMNYDCSAWVADSGFFTPPSNVNFTDFSELLKNPPANR